MSKELEKILCKGKSVQIGEFIITYDATSFGNSERFKLQPCDALWYFRGETVQEMLEKIIELTNEKRKPSLAEPLEYEIGKMLSDIQAHLMIYHARKVYISRSTISGREWFVCTDETNAGEWYNNLDDAIERAQELSKQNPGGK